MPKTTRKNEAVWVDARKRWQINVQLNGKRKTFTSTREGRKGKIEAERKADEWLESGASDDPRFGDLWAEFLLETQLTTGTSNYKKHESEGRIWILPNLEHKRMSAITVQDMQDCINDGYKKGLAKKSLSNIRASFTAFFSYADKRRIRMEAPSRIRIPKDAPVKEKNILQPDGIRTLFSIDYITRYKRKYKSHYIHAWRFAVVTGIRPGELYGLRHEDLNGNKLSIRRARNIERETTDGKNKRSKRFFILPEYALTVLTDQEKMLKEKGIISPWIFPGETGAQTEQLHAYRLWATYRGQHGLASTPYEMRHTMISVTGSDLPEKLLKMIVGHGAEMDTLGVYGHEVDGELERARKIIDEAFKRILE